MSIDFFDIINTVLIACGILIPMVYAIIKTKVDVDHLKKQVTSLFDLWNSRDK